MKFYLILLTLPNHEHCFHSTDKENEAYGCMAHLWHSQSSHLGLLGVRGVLGSLHYQSYCWLHVAGVYKYVYGSEKNGWGFFSSSS